MSIHVFGDGARRRCPGATRLATVTVELQVREVGAPAGQGAHGLQRQRGISRHAESIAVHMYRMGQGESVGGVGERFHDRARRHLISNRVVEAQESLPRA